MFSDLEPEVPSTISTLIDLPIPSTSISITTTTEESAEESIKTTENEEEMRFVDDNETPSISTTTTLTTETELISESTTPKPMEIIEESESTPAATTSKITTTTTTTSVKRERSESIEPSAESIELAAQKRKASAIALADEAKKRSKRMFGLVQGTLNQAKRQVTEDKKIGGQNVKFQEVQLRLNKEKLIMEEKRNRGKEEREIRGEIEKRVAEIAAAESIYKTRQNNKLHLASFLCTTFTPSTIPSLSTSTSTPIDLIAPPFIPQLPHAFKLSATQSNSKSSTQQSLIRPIYYLPQKLLPDQEDQLEDQLAAVKKAIRREKEDWDDIKVGKLKEIEELKEKRDGLVAVGERGEREEKQRLRREEEDREERLKVGREAVEEKEKKMDVEEVQTEKVVVEEAEKVAAVVVEAEASSFSIKGSAPLIAVPVEEDASTIATAVVGDDEMEW